MAHKKVRRKGDPCGLCEDNRNAIRYLITACGWLPNHLEYMIKLVIKDLEEEMKGCK